MKNRFLIFVFTALIAMYSCKETAASGEKVTEEVTEEVEKEMEAPDNDAFKARAAILQAWITAHTQKDLAKQADMLADTLKWSPPYYNANQWLGKDDLLAIIEGYHTDFDNITFAGGVVLPEGPAGTFYAGSAYSDDETSMDPNGIRQYGTWKATHKASGKQIGVKWYAIASFNEDNKIALITEYWDVNGLAAQIAAEE